MPPVATSPVGGIGSPSAGRALAASSAIPASVASCRLRIGPGRVPRTSGTAVSAQLVSQFLSGKLLRRV